MKKREILAIIVALLFVSTTGYGQLPEASPLIKGQSVPEAFWHQEHLIYKDGKATKQNLSAYKGKLVILDFWATWCSGCLAAFPKLASLQKEFKGEMVVLKVTRETAEKMVSFESGPAGKALQMSTGDKLSSIIMDSTLADTFPHKLIPFLTYIGRDGKIEGFSDTDDLNSEVISNMLKGINSPSFNRIDHDMDLPVFINESVKRLISYSVLYKGHISGLSGGNFRRQKDGKVYGQAVTNMPMDWLYKTAIMKLYPWYNETRLILEVANPGAFTAYKLDGSNPDEKFQYYTLDMRVAVDRIDSLYVDMLELLNKNSGYFGKPERRMLKCMVLSRIGKSKKVPIPLQTAGGKRQVSLFSNKAGVITNAPISSLVIAINNLGLSKMPILNETGITEKVDLKVDHFTTLEALDKSLNRYGLELKQSERVMDVFVIRDKVKEKI